MEAWREPTPLPLSRWASLPGPKLATRPRGTPLAGCREVIALPAFRGRHGQDGRVERSTLSIRCSLERNTFDKRRSKAVAHDHWNPKTEKKVVGRRCG